MKLADVVVGEVYVTKISGGLRKVRVLRRTENLDGRTVFDVARPSAPHRVMRRTAAALRPLEQINFLAKVTEDQLRAVAATSLDERVRDAAQAELERRAAATAAAPSE